MAVVIETTLGDITVDLYLEQRPVTCLNFLKLCKMKYYNFNLFHTIRSGFIAQTGDPTGEGSGGQSIFGLLEGPDKRFFSGEKMPKIRHTDTGLLSMVGTGDVMIGSQFFFTLGPDLDSLDGYHCVIGEVTEGHDVLRKLNDVICDETHRPYQDVRITHTVVLEDPFNDPTGLWAPTRSPSPSAERLKGGRIAPDEELDEAQGKTAEEIQEMIEEKEAKARATILEIVGDIPDADIAPPENVLFVCKLNPVTTDDDLEIIFSRFGKINSCEVIRDKKTGDSLQYAFIEFDNKKSCEDAYFKMDNVLIDDRRIHVDFSQSVSKIKWLGKGRGVKHINDDESNGPQDNYVSKDKMRRPRSRDRNEERNNRNHEKDHHEKDRDRERHNDSRTYGRDRKERGHSRDRKSRDERVSKHHKDRRERSKSNSRRHREEKYTRSKKEHRDRSRSRSKDVRSKDRTSKHESNHSDHNESQKNERRNDDTRKKHQEENKDKDDHSRTFKSRSEKSPAGGERSVPNKLLSKHHNKEKPDNNKHDKNSEKHEDYHNSRSDSRNHETNYRKSEKEQESNNRNVENYKLKCKTSISEEREINKKITKHETKNPEPRTPSPTGKVKNVEKNLSKEDHKDKKTKKATYKELKKKRKPSTSSETDSSESSSSTSESSSSSESDHKKKRARRKKKQSTSSSSSSSDSSTSSSTSSDSSTSSSESEPDKKKRKIIKRKGDKKDKKKS
ncbi:peptidyl-prolyl cis-trans isomerase sig-7 [Hyposmocoma kahamanoa]|uniref:peptidyl-prolyl cis-trans isomerase sig-7 n=1 Tax=Hyposmocoma kahamanoa TaxID=1477025 RepID=UPI000E6D5F77|nr:peptidyl-prolyl cis-trans isomerase sig-7 [Hyposmocoma kahamanoa]